jgi:PAS domain S-box-containing protein
MHIDAIGSPEDLHRSLVASSPHAIFLVDCASGRILEVNPATSALLGYREADLVGMEFARVDLAGHAELEALVGRIRRTHHDILGERTFRKRGGRQLPVEVSVNLVIYEGREVLSLFARDISDRVAATLEQERLHRALTLSQKHEAVGRLAAGIAHDFNNQLMVMMLCAQSVIQRLDADDAAQAELGELMAAGKSAAALIRQLLAFSGKQVLRPTLVAIDHVLAQQEKMLRRTLSDGVRIETHYDAAFAQVLADRTQLEQVILNLAVNARDAMPEGGTFSIRTSVVDVAEDFVQDFASLSSGPHVLLKVSDTGTGMDPETLARVFEPFFTTKQPGRGTGLGLATAYGIIKQSGGSIWVSSEPGAGTTFRIYLPISEEEDDVLPNAAARTGPDVAGGTETILVVDDDEMVRVLSARILRELGYSVVEADGPAQARELYLRALEGPGRPIDLVLADVVMPDESGPDMVRALERSAGRVPVVFMSGYATGADRPEDLVSEYVYLEKPLGRTDLARAVRATLDR